MTKIYESPDKGETVTERPFRTSETKDSTTYTVVLDEENDELILPIPEELMSKLGWNENDELEWVIEEDHIKLIKVVETCADASNVV
jgi:hypothetical protein